MPTTAEYLPLQNIPAREWTPEMLIQNKQIELQRLNAKIKQYKIEHNLDNRNFEHNKRLY